jgi:hypothetical protein
MSEFRRPALLLCALAFGITGLAACSDDAGDAKAAPPAIAEEIPGAKEKKITLTEKAAERIGLETTTVQTGAGGRTVIPSSALYFAPEGTAWTYVNTGPLQFLREKVQVDKFDGDSVILTDGPEAGTEIVSIGAALLYGVETGIK